ncbi:MAG: translation initiation factor IF-2 associated domain-containing protein, partial [Candidatus Puniceispirillaceae bacterium]
MTLSSIDASKLRAGPSVGGTRKTVQVEVRRKRAPAAPQRGGTTALEPMVTEPVQTAAALAPSAPAGDDRLTAQERAARVRALQEG